MSSKRPQTSDTPIAPGLLAPRSQHAEREVRRNSGLRQARTCYGHLAGVAGVQLMAEMQALGWLEEQPGLRPVYALTPLGRDALAYLGVNTDLPRGSSRAFAYGCLDWTERHYHLGGFLGEAVFQALSDVGLAERGASSREVKLKQPLNRWLAS